MRSISATTESGDENGSSSAPADSKAEWSRRRRTIRHRLIPAIVSLLAACQPLPPVPSDNTPVGPAAEAALPVRRPPPAAPVAPPKPATPTIIQGTGVIIGNGGAPEPGSAEEPGDITLNFVDADVREVARTVLGDVLHLNYAIDSKVQATVTIQTSRPLQRDQVLPTLQAALRSSNLALVETDGVYRVIPVEDAVHSGAEPVVVGRGQRPPANASYNVQIFPLKYVSAEELKQTVEPLLPKGATLQTDKTRNLLILSGSGQDLSTAAELVRTFDVDWLKGMSFGIFPLQLAEPRDVAGELNSIFGQGGSVPLGGVLRFAPLERMNAVLAISPQRSYLEQARAWIQRLDQGSEQNTPRLFEYHVQNSRATDLAKVLSQLFGSGEVSTVAAETAPGKAFTDAVTATSQDSSGTGASSLGGGLPQMGLPGAGGIPGASSTGLPSASPMASPSTSGTGTGDQSQTSARPQTGPGLSSALGNAFGADRSQGGKNDLPPVRIVADEKNNALVIYAKPRDYQMIQDALQKLDVLPLQVLIEATIAEVTLNDNLQYGTQWFIKRGGSNFTLNNATSTPTSLVPTQVFPGFNYAFLAGSTNVVLSALSAVTDVNVVSSPQLLVLDHHVATLQVGDEVPVPTAQIQSTVTSGAPVVNTIEYLNTGVILHVSPRVNSNGVITLDISQEVSDVSLTTSSTLNAPTINQRRVESTVSVSDGETVALGGLITDNRTVGNSGVPFLTDLPVVGPLFGTREDNKARTELLVLLSPRVLHDSSEARAVTDELRNRLHTIEPIVGRVH